MKGYDSMRGEGDSYDSNPYSSKYAKEADRRSRPSATHTTRSKPRTDGDLSHLYRPNAGLNGWRK